MGPVIVPKLMELTMRNARSVPRADMEGFQWAIHLLLFANLDFRWRRVFTSPLQYFVIGIRGSITTPHGRHTSSSGTPK